VIRPHRRRHFWIFTILAVILPLVLVAAIGVRGQAPIANRVPQVLDEPSLRRWTTVSGAEAQVNPRIHLRLLASDPVRSRLGIELTLTQALREPDVAVYWTASTGAAPDQLPRDAVLLGTIGKTGPRRLPLPPRATEILGSLILYSVAHRAVLDVMTIPGPRPGPADE